MEITQSKKPEHSSENNLFETQAVCVSKHSPNYRKPIPCSSCQQITRRSCHVWFHGQSTEVSTYPHKTTVIGQYECEHSFHLFCCLQHILFSLRCPVCGASKRNQRIRIVQDACFLFLLKQMQVITLFPFAFLCMAYFHTARKPYNIFIIPALFFTTFVLGIFDSIFVFFVAHLLAYKVALYIAILTDACNITKPP